MHSIQLSASTRPITTVQINRNGDMLFATGKDGVTSTWYTDIGERLGTYDGVHRGAVYDLDVDFDSKLILTGGADCKLGVWNVTTGTLLRMVNLQDRVSAVKWACGDQSFLVCTVSQNKSQTLVYDFDPDIWAQGEAVQPRICFPSKGTQGHVGKINAALWGPVNNYIFTAGEDGTIRQWDMTGNEVQRVDFNPNGSTVITSLSISPDNTMLCASGRDGTARLFDIQSLKCLRVFRSGKPLNCALLHPTLDCIIVCGGIAEHEVAIKAHSKGTFEVEFFHTIFEEKIGEVKTGHISPITCMAMNHDGSLWATGAVEGAVRLFTMPSGFEKKYLEMERKFTQN